MTGFVIHALPVLHGILGFSPAPGSGGDYAADLAHLKDWRPAVVFSMIDDAEMAAAGARDLGRDVMLLGTRWVQVPVRDGGVPGVAAQRGWARAAPLALAALKGGGRVLIHCRGGCGRSGMTALRLMIAAGESPDAALARLRAVRPCAVETEAQLRWARQGRVWDGRMAGGS